MLKIIKLYKEEVKSERTLTTTVNISLEGNKFPIPYTISSVINAAAITYMFFYFSNYFLLF